MPSISNNLNKKRKIISVELHAPEADFKKFELDYEHRIDLNGSRHLFKKLREVLEKNNKVSDKVRLGDFNYLTKVRRKMEVIAAPNAVVMIQC